MFLPFTQAMTKHSKYKLKRMFNVSISYSGGREQHEAVVEVTQSIIYIRPGPSGYRIAITGEDIIAYDDDIAVDAVLLDLNEPPETRIVLRFANAAAKASFIDLIRVISSSSEDSGNSTSTSESPSPPLYPPQD